jgi:hypothetical protein
MADTVVHIGENSPEYVAYLLFKDIRALLHPQKLTEDQILNLYAECIATVRDPRIRAAKYKSAQ